MKQKKDNLTPNEIHQQKLKSQKKIDQINSSFKNQMYNSKDLEERLLAADGFDGNSPLRTTKLISQDGSPMAINEK